MSVKIKGLDKALRDLDKKSEATQKAVKDVLADTATGIELNAIQNAPASFAGMVLNIKQRINKIRENNGLNWKVGVENADRDFEIEAWLEFGTGLSAKQILNRPEYTPEIREIARSFFRTGDGTIKGKPYLFPAFFRNTANLVQEIEKEIKKDIK